MSRRFERDLPELSDPLGEVLYLLRLNGALYCRSDLSAPWGIEMPAMEGKIMFHIVMEGDCWLRVDGQEDIHLPAGSLALLPEGQGHEILSAPDSVCEPLFDIPMTPLSERYESLRISGGGEQADLICGVIGFDHAAGEKLIQQLPSCIAITDADEATGAALKSVINMMALEAKSLRLGGETVMAHLADIVVIQAIRQWMEQAPEAQQGWLGALRDPKVGKALSAIHTDPAYGWTVDTLADAAGMSRSGFAARFSDMMGTSVKQYLTEWRMGLARAQLLRSPMPLGELAEQLGYQSEAAFSRAYKRVMGESPLKHSLQKQVG